MTATVTQTPASSNGRSTEALGDRLVGMMNDAATAVALSVGHRTGLFDAMTRTSWATSLEIADEAGLQERYVREWLGAMVTARLVDYDPTTRTYDLPDEHAALLTRDGEAGNVAAAMQWIAVLASVEDRVVESFKKGGGVTYGCFHRFHEVMAAESKQTVVDALMDNILPMAPGLTDRLESGIDVLDIGCGSGLAMIELAARYPNSSFAGYDLCEEAIERANQAAAERGITNARFETRDLTEWNQTQAYDLITAFDAIHDQKAPDRVLAAIHEAMRPGGTFLMQDIRASSHLEKNIGTPLGSFLYTISFMHCMTVSLAQDGAGLGTCWGEELAVEMLGEAGFTDVRVEKPEYDIQNNFYIAHRH